MHLNYVKYFKIQIQYNNTIGIIYIAVKYI